MKRIKIFILAVTALCLTRQEAAAQIQANPTCDCNCLAPFFEYLSNANRMGITQASNTTVFSIIRDARLAGYTINYEACPILAKNYNKLFYLVTYSPVYKARIGDCFVSLKTPTGTSVSAGYKLKFDSCSASGKIYFSYADIVTKKMKVTRSITVTQVISSDSMFTGTFPSYIIDDQSPVISAASQNNPNGTAGKKEQFRRLTYFAIDSINTLPSNVTIASTKFMLHADPAGFLPPNYPLAHVTNAESSNTDPAMFYKANFNWSAQTRPDSFFLNHSFIERINITSPFQDYSYGNANGLLGLYYLNPSKGFVLKYGYERAYKMYATFCSEKHPDTTKHPSLEVSYYPGGSRPVNVVIEIDSCYQLQAVDAGFCYSAVTDTSVNPYVNNMLGTWRRVGSYNYNRNLYETSTATATNVRTDGAVGGSGWYIFGGFSTDRYYRANVDSLTWVSEGITTKYNRKGMEIENKTTDGRYNAGLYGFGGMLPVATTQNSRHRESAFESFEDYYYGTSICDTSCPAGRSFDFSSYRHMLDTMQQHSGRYSLKVPAGGTAGVNAEVVNWEDDLYRFSTSRLANVCGTSLPGLKDVRADRSALIAGFSPISGKSLLVSLWLKEEQQCNGSAYTNSRVAAVVTSAGQDISFIAKPVGNIIEGWQKFETVVELPAGTSSLGVYLQATGSTAVYFDDIRLHPFNANMKSYAYDPLNLRLMAEMDENNYATFFEYDDDGTLVRVKKETSRGIKTISETRSGLIKE